MVWPMTQIELPPVMEVTSLRVQFSGIVAVDDVTFDARAGQVLGLIGPNGAGKTTTFNAITGMVPSTGTIAFNGTEISGMRTEQIARLGIARTFQHAAVVPEVTGRDTVLIGAHRHGRFGWIRSGLRLGSAKEAREAAERADSAIERLGLQSIADRTCSELGLPNLKQVELARAIAFEPRVLLLDEPANGLTHSEVDELAEKIAGLHRDSDLCIVLVEHHMGLVRAVSDKLVVLNFGAVLAQGEPNEVLSRADVVEAYLGVGAA